MRVQQPRRDELPEDERAVFDKIAARFSRSRTDRQDEVRFEGDAGPYFGALLTSPPFAGVIADYGTVVRTRGEFEDSYSHADRELVDQVLQYDWNWHGVQVTHIPDALAVGVRIEAIEALRDGSEEKLTDRERQLVAYIREVVSGTVTDESFNGIRELMGHRAAVEYTIFIAFLLMTLRLHQAFDVPAQTPEEVDRMLDDFKSGRRQLPNPSHRFG